ncbi:hypothetical protein ACIBL5_06020 [Streptomyces sp. NPDC050516]|uniref:hypothetical protein n=1 Tax=Streptomyces sp. NPDC050516 TaxID=3365621 RepID=UPI0037B743B1
MGAIDFYTIATGDSLQDTFERAREDAAHEHGRGGYSGTVHEKDSVMLFDEPRRPEAEALERARALLHGRDPRVDDKRGPAGALPVTTGDSRDGWLFFGVSAY